MKRSNAHTKEIRAVANCFQTMKLHFKQNSRFDLRKSPRVNLAESILNGAYPILDQYPDTWFDFILSCFSKYKSRPVMIHDIMSSEYEKNFKEWVNYVEKIENSFYNEMNALIMLAKNKEVQLSEVLIGVNNKKCPPVYQMLIRDRISIVTLVILNGVFNFTDKIKTNDPLVNGISYHIKQYQSVLYFDRAAMINILREIRNG